MTGWAETEGGGLLYRLVMEAFARAAESDEIPPVAEKETTP